MAQRSKLKAHQHIRPNIHFNTQIRRRLSSLYSFTVSGDDGKFRFSLLRRKTPPVTTTAVFLVSVFHLISLKLLILNPYLYKSNEISNLKFLILSCYFSCSLSTVKLSVRKACFLFTFFFNFLNLHFHLFLNFSVILNYMHQISNFEIPRLELFSLVVA